MAANIQEPLQQVTGPPRPPGERSRLVSLAKALELTVSVILILIAFTEIYPKLLPKPALVYSISNERMPGEFIAKTEFWNPNKNWPLESVSAEWGIDSPEVALLLDFNALGRGKTDSPSPLRRTLTLDGTFPGDARFVAYLKSSQAFLVENHVFRAALPLIENGDKTLVPVEALQADEWAARSRSAYLRMGAGIAALAFILLAAYRFFREVERKLP